MATATAVQIEEGAPWRFVPPSGEVRRYHVESAEMSGNKSDIVQLRNVDTGRCAWVTRGWMLFPRADGEWQPGWE